jgi:WbqC-like protein family
MKDPRSQLDVSEIEARPRRGSNPGITVPASDSPSAAAMSSAVTTSKPEGKRVAIVQSNYIPWKGYFDLIAAVDEFILLDDVQYTKRDWRNRNLIKTAQGAQWLTIPVANKGRQMQLIDETEISEPWAEQHWARIRHSYGKTPFFSAYESPLAGLYEAAAGLKRLSDINRLFLEGLCKLLNIGTRLVRSRDYASTGNKTEKLLTLCQSASAASYLSGPSARDYLDETAFANAGIVVAWMDYGGYPAYPQLYGEFDHYVSVIDLLFNTGPEARRHMKF